jgi:large repetitive protein
MTTATYNDNNTTKTVDIDSTASATTVNLNDSSGSNDLINISAATVAATVNLDDAIGSNENISIIATSAATATVNLDDDKGTNNQIAISGATVTATVNLDDTTGANTVSIAGTNSTTATVNLDDSTGANTVTISGANSTTATVNLDDSTGANIVNISGKSTVATVNLNDASGADVIDITGTTATATVNLDGSSKNISVTLVGKGTGTINAANSTGADTLIGGAGKDTINGGYGPDTLDLTGGGTINAGSGNDLGVYTLSDHYSLSGKGVLTSLAGDVDYYYGQGGTNTLELVFTSAQYALPAVQAQLMSFMAFLAGDPGVNQTFTFNFGAASGALTVAGWQLLDVQVQGQTGATSTYDVAPSGQSVSLAASDAMVNLSGANDAVTLTGSADTATISGANDVVTASGDSNTIAITGANETVTLTGNDDTVTSSISDTSLDLTATNATITLTGSDDTVTLNTDSILNIKSKNSTITEHGHNDTYNVFGIATGDEITFTSFGNTINLSGDNDTLNFTGAGDANTLNIVSGSIIPDPIVVNVMNMTAAGLLTIDGGGVASTNGDAVDIIGSSGDVNLMLEGAITGAQGGVKVQNDGNIAVVVGAGAALEGVANAGLSVVDTSAAGDITITMTPNGPDSSDMITSSILRALSAVNEATGTSTESTIKIDAHGTITAGGFAAIFAGYQGGTTVATADPSGKGSVSVSSDAMINAIGLADGSGQTGAIGIDAFNVGAGDVTVETDAGSFITSSGPGINAVNWDSSIAASADSTIRVTAYGRIDTDIATPGESYAGINAGYRGGVSTGTPNSNVYGNVFVDSYAIINAPGLGDGNGYSGEDGINAFNYGPGDITVTTEASSSITSSITSAGPGISAVNSDTIIPTSANSTITVDASGAIVSGSDAGIVAGYGGSNVYGDVSVTLEPDATITAHGGPDSNSYSGEDGINTFNNGFGSITVTTLANSVITSDGPGINATNSDGIPSSATDSTITVTANGTITAGADAGIIAGYNDSNLYGDVFVYSYANIMANGSPNSGEAGIDAYNGSTGDITVDTYAGSMITSAGPGISASNFDTGIPSTDSSTITVNAAGMITAYATAGIVATYDTSAANYGDVVITSSAIILANLSPADANGGPAGIVAVTDFGSITINTISPSSITANGVGILAYSPGDGTISVNNAGLINAMETGIFAGNDDSFAGNNDFSAGFHPHAGSITIINSGDVSGGGYGALGLFAAGGGVSVMNSAGGMIEGTPSNTLPDSGTAILAPDPGYVTITNAGTIMGDVQLGSATTLGEQNTFENQPGGVWDVSGNNSFGLGTSTITNDAHGSIVVDGSTTFGGGVVNLVNNGMVTIDDSASLTIAGAISGTGPIQINEGATLTVNSFDPASTNVVTFENDNATTTGTLVDQQTSPFSLTVTGFAGSDVIDLAGMQYSPSMMPTEIGTTNQYIVSDGVGHSVTITLAGAGTLALSLYGNSGTMISDPPSGASALAAGAILAGSASSSGAFVSHPQHPATLGG